ncbi:MAG: ABC transporter ATP-binding protein [Spirochaetales bacterium]|nr:ABC transporter ATP-binding protein [Spirochaetales bacterium]
MGTAAAPRAADSGRSNGTLLEIRGLDVVFELERGSERQSADAEGDAGGKAAVQSRVSAHPLRGIDLTMARGEVHSLVGESGSGKTVTATSVIGLLPIPPARVLGGEILFEGRNLVGLPESERRKVRGREIAMVFQEPAKYLNPALRVGEQIIEMLVLHLELSRRQAEERALELLELVGLHGGRRILRSYPHELSGGMKQRVMIAMAISCDPDLLIADEPTTALDVTLQLQILRLILELKSRLDMGILFISHDLGVVHDISERVSVIYAGKIVESARKEKLFANPLHPYTLLLLASIPDASRRGKPLKVIPGTVPDAEHIPSGCAFHPRCPLAEEICRVEVPPSLEYRDGTTALSPAEAGSVPLAESHTAACHMIGKKWLSL